MNSKTTGPAGEMQRRAEVTGAIRDGLRDLGIQLSLLNHHVGAQLELKDVDLDCLDLIDREGPISPRALARRAGLHPATLTGILDRLERAGWVTRERDPRDRRAVRVLAPRKRNAELMRLYAGMSRSMNRILAGYDDAELAVIADFLRRTAQAGRSATEELAAD